MMASTSRIFARNLLPSPSPLLAPFTKPCNIHNLYLGGNYSVWIHQFGQLVKSFIRYIYQSHIGFYCTKT